MQDLRFGIPIAGKGRSARLQTLHAGVVLAIAVAIQQPALDNRAAATFVRELQRHIARDDRPAVSALVQYPLTVFAGGIRIPIGDAAALLQNYDLVFSPALKALIAQAALPAGGRSASGASVIVTDNLVTIGVDAVHIRPVGGGLKITRISVPLASSSTATVPDVRRAVAHNPRRLALSVGQIQRAGALGEGERDAYLLSAMKNQLLEVRINRVSGRDIVARITSIKSGAPIDSRAQAGVRTWIGRIPEDGDYRIEVVRLAAGAARLSYIIVISMR